MFHILINAIILIIIEQNILWVHGNHRCPWGEKNSTMRPLFVATTKFSSSSINTLLSIKYVKRVMPCPCYLRVEYVLPNQHAMSNTCFFQISWQHFIFAAKILTLILILALDDKYCCSWLNLAKIVNFVDVHFKPIAIICNNTKSNLWCNL